MSELMILREGEGKPHRKDPTYLPVYERHFSRFKGLSPVVLEIGVQDGTSLSMWRQYFGLDAVINGIDIDPQCRQFHDFSGNRRVFIGDQTDTKFLNEVIEVIGPPDIIIDDGSHVSEHIRTSFEFLYPRMTRHGIYLVEDLHMCYGGGVAVQNSFIDYCKDRLDDIQHAFRSAPMNEFARTTMSMHMYSSVAVFERGLPIIKNLLAHNNDYLDFQEGGMVLKQLPRTNKKVRP